MSLAIDADDVVTSRREDSHVAQLEYEHSRNTERIALLHERQGRIERELEQVRASREKREVRAEPKVRAIGEPETNGGPLKPLRKGKDLLADERLRDCAVRLRSFTVPEIAAMCKVKPGTVRHHHLFLKWLEDGTIKETGERFMGSPCLDYTPPEEPGKAFEVQQQAAPAAPPPEPSDPVPGAGGNQYLAALDKQVRVVVRSALRDGWDLRPTGSGHYELTRDGYRPLGVSGSPQNAHEEAHQVRRRLRTARPLRAQTAPIPHRGRPVAHTGRAPGTSGKPGRDRKIAKQTGRKVKKKRET